MEKRVISIKITEAQHLTDYHADMAEYYASPNVGGSCPRSLDWARFHQSMALMYATMALDGRRVR